MKKIGILGSSFNPIHIGHLIIAQESLILLGLDEILFIPTFKPYHKNVDLLEYNFRYEMTKLVLEDNPNFKISDIERNLDKNSYSYDIVKLLKEKEDADYYFIMGSDSLLNLDTWYRYKDFLKMVNIIVFKRPGYDVTLDILNKYKKLTNKEIHYIDNVRIEISSSSIRENIKNNIYPRYLLLDKTINYIKENKLWK